MNTNRNMKEMRAKVIMLSRQGMPPTNIALACELTHAEVEEILEEHKRKMAGHVEINKATKPEAPAVEESKEKDDADLTPYQRKLKKRNDGIIQLLAEHKTPQGVAEIMGCKVNVVYAVRRKAIKDGILDLPLRGHTKKEEPKKKVTEDKPSMTEYERQQKLEARGGEPSPSSKATIGPGPTITEIKDEPMKKENMPVFATADTPEEFLDATMDPDFDGECEQENEPAEEEERLYSFTFQLPVNGCVGGSPHNFQPRYKNGMFGRRKYILDICTKCGEIRRL